MSSARKPKPSPGPARRPVEPRVLFKVLTALAALAVALVLAEAAVRLSGAGPQYYEPARDMVRPHGVYTKAPYAFVPHAVFRTVYPSDPRGYFGPDRSVDHEFNSAGWRDLEHTVAKPPSTYRILGLGDSYLFGQGVRFEHLSLTRLRETLQQAAPAGLQVEAINTGVPAFNTEAERQLLAARGLDYQPDLVIVHFVLNDIEQNLARQGPKLEFFREYTAVYNRPDRLARYSQLWGLARQTYQRRVEGGRYLQASLHSYLDDPSRFEAMWASLQGIRDLCRERHVALLVAVFPFLVQLDADYPFRPIHQRLVERCQRAGIPVLDLYHAFKGQRGPELWVHPVDQHPNETAHAIAAAAMFDHLMARRAEFRLFSPASE